jgi:hypothetical protein
MSELPDDHKSARDGYLSSASWLEEITSGSIASPWAMRHGASAPLTVWLGSFPRIA